MLIKTQLFLFLHSPCPRSHLCSCSFIFFPWSLSHFFSSVFSYCCPHTGFCEHTETLRHGRKDLILLHTLENTIIQVFMFLGVWLGRFCVAITEYLSLGNVQSPEFSLELMCLQSNRWCLRSLGSCHPYRTPGWSSWPLASAPDPTLAVAGIWGLSGHMEDHSGFPFHSTFQKNIY